MCAKKIIGVVPARLHSTRFPKKVLARLWGKPILEWIFLAAERTKIFSDFIFAVDDPLTAQLVASFKGKWVMTSLEHQNGTKRLIEVAKTSGLQGDLWVNWQGDEPLISEKILQDLLQMEEIESADVWSLKRRIDTLQELKDPNVVKVVTKKGGEALYFSRSLIPFERKSAGIPSDLSPYYRHIGLYAYTTKALERIDQFKRVSPLEEIECLEQLTFLYEGMRIQLFETDEKTYGIDVLEDLLFLEQHPELKPKI